MPERRFLSAGSDTATLTGPSPVESAVAPADEVPSVNLDGFFSIGGGSGAGAVKVDLVRCGNSYVGRLEAGDHTFTRDFGMVASRTTEDILVIAVTSGQLQGLASSGPVAVGANEVLMIDLAEVLMVQARDLVATVWLLPRSIGFAGQFGTAWWHGFVLPSTHKVSHLVVSMMQEATKLCRELDDRADSSLIDSVIVMLSSVLRSEQASAPRLDRPALSATQASIKRFIDENLSDPDLAVETLAKRFGMSRASLYREFANFGGIAEYIRRQRLQRAMHELRARGDQPLRLAALARKVGFKSTASFSRSFTAAFGVAPRTFWATEREARPPTVEAGAGRRK